MVILIFIAFILLCIATDIILNSLNKKKVDNIVLEEIVKPLNENNISVPAGLLYSKNHLWLFMEKDGTIKLGIDDFLSKVIGKITKLDMKKNGEMIERGKPAFYVIQNGKKIYINSPISGKVIMNNENYISNSYFYNWIYTIEPLNWKRESDFLLLCEKYKESLSNEFNRLKEFFSSLIINNNCKLVLQDGGEIKENILENYGPDVWEDFQNKFIDYPR